MHREYVKTHHHQQPARAISNAGYGNDIFRLRIYKISYSVSKIVANIQKFNDVVEKYLSVMFMHFPFIFIVWISYNNNSLVPTKDLTWRDNLDDVKMNDKGKWEMSWTFEAEKSNVHWQFQLFGRVNNRLPLSKILHKIIRF